MDRFLTEICHVHDLRASIRGLSDAERSQLIRNMVDVEGVDSEAGDWIFDARDAQVPPRDLDWAWLFLGGRGTGKTRAASAWHVQSISTSTRVEVQLAEECQRRRTLALSLGGVFSLVLGSVGSVGQIALGAIPVPE
jgi:hypothetical protein